MNPQCSHLLSSDDSTILLMCWIYRQQRRMVLNNQLLTDVYVYISLGQRHDNFKWGIQGDTLPLRFILRLPKLLHSPSWLFCYITGSPSSPPMQHPPCFCVLPRNQVRHIPTCVYFPRLFFLRIAFLAHVYSTGNTCRCERLCISQRLLGMYNKSLLLFMLLGHIM